MSKSIIYKLKKTLCLANVMLLLTACSGNDKAEVNLVTNQYLAAWKAGDEALMSSVLHDRFVKRAMLKIPEDGKFPPEQDFVWKDDTHYLHEMDKAILVQKTAKKKPSNDSADLDFKIIDMEDNSAMVKIDNRWGFEYLQLSKTNQRWYIVNVLWTVH